MHVPARAANRSHKEADLYNLHLGHVEAARGGEAAHYSSRACEVCVPDANVLPAIAMTSSRSDDVVGRVSTSFQAPAEAVFAAWIEPELMQQWLFKSDSNDLHAASDASVGGRFSVLEREGARTIEHWGEYLVLERPSRLIFALRVPQHFSGTARLEMTLTPKGTGCVLTLVLRGAGPPDAEQLWSMMLDRLKRVLGESE